MISRSFQEDTSFLLLMIRRQVGRFIRQVAPTTWNWNSYTEHMDFASDKIADLVGKDQSFTLEVEGDVLTQIGTLSNGKALSERFKRLEPEPKMNASAVNSNGDVRFWHLADIA